MNPVEVLPLLIVVLLLVSAGGGDVEQMEITFDGTHDAETVEDVLVVAGGTTTVPANASVASEVYVIGGTVRIDGRVDGDVTVLAGNLSVTDGGAVDGTLRTIGGQSTVADGATVTDVSQFEPPAPSNSPVRRASAFLLQFLVLGFAGWWLVRRRPGLLDNVGHAVTDHTLVSGVVGALAATTLLVLFVYMAFTLVLLPVTVVGLLVELLVVLYGQLALGYLIGTRLPIAEADLATVADVGALLLAMELLGAIPYLGAAVQFGLLAVGFGPC